MGLSSQVLVQNQLTEVRTHQALARQNALVGVHIALGQLQRATAIPEPATAAVVFALAALGYVVMRRKHAQRC